MSPHKHILKKIAPDVQHAKLTSHGAVWLAGGVGLLLIWRTSGGHKIVAWAAGLIILTLVLTNYQTIIKQLEG